MGRMVLLHPRSASPKKANVVPIPTVDAALIVRQIQTRVENEKATLARRVHDELSGYLLAATMDLSALRRTVLPDEVSLKRFERIKQMLHAALDVSSAVTEELHPSLLDNVGLFAALRREMQRMCARSKVQCQEHFPEIEPRLSSAEGIALFRIGQEALFIAESQARVSVVDFHIATNSARLWMHISADVAIGIPDEESRGGEAWASAQHRVHSLGGSVQIGTGGNRATALIIEVPLATP
jgi:signal transduction histidine kinase